MAVLVFDFDSTLVSVEGLDELFACSLDGAPDRDARIAAFEEITDLGMAGALSADASLARRLAILDADRPLIATVAAKIRDRLSPSVERQLAFFKDDVHRIHVVSGGFEELIHPTLERMGLPSSRLLAHRFRYTPAGRVTGLDPGTVLARGGKPAAVAALSADPGEVWMVGDGITDLEVRQLGLADRFVAYTENRHRPPVVEKADHVVGSMEELLTLLETQ